MITIKSIKAYLKREEKRLEQRRLDQTILLQESASLQGSLMTIKKIRNYVEGKE